ncbi:hypothetical protein F5884DRAFT_805692 [Xylogone sp. PMI_703]|nr:hypothetical protein F5884DRAFT_805692 [Xylogone sp. PMI_703]
MDQAIYNQRGSLAAQACETCRSRKRKCDETRPKCSLCKRLRVSCYYKDQNKKQKKEHLSEILSLLRKVNSAVELVASNGLDNQGILHQQENSITSSNGDLDYESNTATQLWSLNTNLIPYDINESLAIPYRHSTAAHRLLQWPFIYQKMQMLPFSQEFPSQQAGIQWFLHVQSQHSKQKPLSTKGFTIKARNTANILFEIPYATIVLWVDMYFDTFNFIHPLLDRQLFFRDTLHTSLGAGSVQDFEQTERNVVLTLLVIALGQLALEGTIGEEDPGENGGSNEQPPGLLYFNEARRRLGFIETAYSLEVVQIQALASLYYATCFRHVESWRMSTRASATCYLLITSHAHDWDTVEGDLLKRVYWHCVAIEVGHHLELDLPYTSIMDLEETVPLPSFMGPYCERDERANQISQFHHHCAALVTLRRICRNFHRTVDDALQRKEINDTNPLSQIDMLASIIRDSASQLQQWRNMLPTGLKWEDDGRGIVNGQMTFITDLRDVDDDTSKAYRYARDIQVAMLRIRYYYAQYIIYRPLIYKALHFPTRMTAQDVYDVSVCLKCCLNWPMMSPRGKLRKPLIPFLFCWSQNFLGILVLFYCTLESPLLQSIRKEYLDTNDVKHSLSLMRDWIRSYINMDALAAWSCGVTHVLSPKLDSLME